uniref:Uncharacterized protein LOC111106637 isoform X2 n=1 Tax=Crassostrea virginica TaxID=6565 RepID=A0A8B8B190_CRAVI|nr:uncharacterized protein LOC111106637 isoform X2 [Crassostrea virginica]
MFSDSYLNMVVLTLPNGTFCICYQRMDTPYTVDRRSPVKRPKKSPGSNPSPHSVHSLSESDEETTDVNYYICMVHHAKCVTGLPYSRKYELNFFWHGDYLMVMLPGHFVHLLNVGIEFEPCQHILLHDRSIASVIRNGDFKVTGSHDSNPSISVELSLLVTAAVKLHLSNTILYEIQRDYPTAFPGISFYDNRNGEVWRIVVNMEMLVQLFIHCYMSTTRARLLHYVLTRDFSLIKRLFEMLSNDIPSSEVPALMAEYLIGWTRPLMMNMNSSSCLSDTIRLLRKYHSHCLKGSFPTSLLLDTGI